MRNKFMSLVTHMIVARWGLTVGFWQASQPRFAAVTLGDESPDLSGLLESDSVSRIDDRYSWVPYDRYGMSTVFVLHRDGLSSRCMDCPDRHSITIQHGFDRDHIE